MTSWYEQDPNQRALTTQQPPIGRWFDGPMNSGSLSLATQQPPAYHEPGAGDALITLGLGKLATGITIPEFTIPLTDKRVGPWTTPDFSDTLQNALLIQWNDILLRWSGPGTEIAIPSVENIAEDSDHILRTWHSILPDKILGPAVLDNAITQKTNELNHRLASGIMDNEYEPTEREKQIAQELLALAGTVSPQELTTTFNNSVFGANADVVSNGIDSTLAANYQQYLKRLERVNQKPPTTWYTADALARLLLMSPTEKKAFGNIIWSLTPSTLWIRDIKSSEEDARRIPLENFSNIQSGSDRYYAYPGTFDYIDILRKRGGVLFQPTINKLSQKNLGGLVYVRTAQRNEPLAEFPVEDGQVTSQVVNTLGNIAAWFKVTLPSRMKIALQNQQTAPKYQVRPNIVADLLPSRLLFEANVGVTDGQIDWQPAINQFEAEQEHIQNTERQIALYLATHGYINPDGTPTRLKHTLDQLDGTKKTARDKEIEARNLNELPKETQYVKENTGTCGHCGAPKHTKYGPCAYCDA